MAGFDDLLAEVRQEQVPIDPYEILQQQREREKAELAKFSPFSYHAAEAIKNAPRNIYHSILGLPEFAKETYSTLSSPLQSIQSGKMQELLKGTGKMALGTAGAGSGAAVGALLAPATLGLSIPIGMGAGWAAGRFGFDKALQGAGLEEPSTIEQDLAEAGTQFGSALAPGAAAKVAVAPFKFSSLVAGPQTAAGVTAETATALQKLGISIDDIPPPPPGGGYGRRSLAEVIADPGLKAKVAALEAEAAATNATEFGAQRALRAEERLKNVYDPESPTTRDPAQILVARANMQRAAKEAAIADAKAAAGDSGVIAKELLAKKKTAISEQAPKAGYLDELGESVEPIVRPHYEAAHTAAQNLYKNTDLTAPVPLRQYAHELLDEIKGFYQPRVVDGKVKTSDLPPAVASELTNIMHGEGAVTNLQRAIDTRAALYKRAESAGSLKDASAFRQMAEKITKAIEESAENPKGMSSQNLANWQVANAGWREFAKTYRTGAVGKALAKTRYGESKLGKSKIATTTLLDPEGLDSVLKATNNSPQIIAKAESAVMRQITDATGQIIPKKAEAFLSSRRELFQRLPNLRTELERGVRQLKEIDVAEKRLGLEIREHTKTIKGKLDDFEKSIMGELSSGKVDPSQAVFKLLSRPTAEIRTFLDKLPPGGRAAVAKSIYSTLVKRALTKSESVTKLEAKTLVNSLRQAEDKIRLLVGEKRFGKLANTVDDYLSERAVDQAGRLPSKGGSPTRQLFSPHVNRALGRKGKAAKVLSDVPPWVKHLFGLGAAGAVYATKSIPLAGIITAGAAVGGTLMKRSSRLLRESLYENLMSPETAAATLTKATSRKAARTARDVNVQTTLGVIGGESSEKGTPTTGANANPPLSDFDSLLDEVKGAAAPKKEARNTSEPLVRAIIAQESGGNFKAMSHKGAKGLMQIMPNTAKEIAKELGVKKYDIHDPETNKMFGTYYINKMLDEFNGDVKLALAAYNAGPTKVKNWVKLYGRNWENIADNLRFRNHYTETVKYVPQVLKRLNS
jgi:hypothetical protein